MKRERVGHVRDLKLGDVIEQHEGWTAGDENRFVVVRVGEEPLAMRMIALVDKPKHHTEENEHIWDRIYTRGATC